MAEKWVQLKSQSNNLYPRTQSTLLQWGGPNVFASLSPLDAALSDELSANRFAEMPNENFVFERSDNAGTTWTTYTADGYELVTSSTNTVCNANVLGSQSSSNWHRFTIDVRPGSSNNFYGEIRKFLFFISTDGATGCRVKIEGSTFATPDTFVQIADAPIGGWSGWNVINVSITAGLGLESFYKKLRFTFSQTGVDSNYASRLHVQKMRVYCANCWAASGNFALRNRTYYLLNGEQRQQYSIRFEGGKKLYGIATNADLANNSLKLNGKADTYYLNYQNLTNKPTLKLVACPYDAGVSNGATANPYINTVFDGAVSSSIQLYSSGLTVQSDSAGKVTIEPSMAPSIFAADTTIATVPGFSTNPYLRVYYGGKYNTGPRLKSGTNIQIQSDASNNITINSTIPNATAGVTGLMTSTQASRLAALWNGVGTHSFAHATGKFTGISGTVYYSIFADKDNYNDITKIHGVLKVTYATTSDTHKYRMINLSNFRNALGTSLYGHLTHANFLHGMWWGSQNDGTTLDIHGYGTGMEKNDTNDYIGLGRYYTTSFSYGNWPQGTFLDQMKHGCVFIEMWFKNF
jgi:hypothetical protein